MRYVNLFKQDHFFETDKITRLETVNIKAAGKIAGIKFYNLVARFHF